MKEVQYKLTVIMCAAFVAAGMALGAEASGGEKEAVPWTITEQLASNIWRVRMARDGKLPESGMNRYGIIDKMPVLESAEGVVVPNAIPSIRQVGDGFEIKFPLEKGERVYGLGDASRDGIQRRPGRYEIYVANVTSYIPVPFVWTTGEWGVFMNTTWRHVFDVGKTDPDALTISAPRGDVDFYFFTGKDARALIDAYTRVTGRPSLLPIWGYGFTFVANQHIDQFELMHETMEFRDRSIPCDTIGLEPCWMEKFYDDTTRKRWNPAKFTFPFWCPKGSITFPSAMQRVGMKLSLWLCCNYDFFKYEEELAAGIDMMQRTGVKPVKTETGEIPDDADNGVWTDGRVAGTERPASTGVPGAYRGDEEPFSHKEGERPWFEHLQQFVDQGVQAFKLDGAYQVTPWNGKPNRKWSNGMDDEEAHNLYPIVYGKQMARGYEWYTGKRAMVYSAGGYAGLQRNVASWAGDTGGGVKPLVSVLNLGLSGHPHQSCDMNFDGKDAAGLHFGFLMPWSQQNNWDYWNLPWVNPAGKVDAFRRYAELRYRLIPYIYSTAAESAKSGWPIVRPLEVVHPEVAEYQNRADTYYFGDSMLVGVYGSSIAIPSGTWHEWRTDNIVKGSCEVSVSPDWTWGGALYVKAGAVIPTWPQKQYLEKGWNERVEVHVWPDAEGSFMLYEDDGVSLDYRSGAGAWTELRLERSKKDMCFVVGRRKGSYADMPETRDFAVVVHFGEKVKTIEIGPVGADGARIEVCREGAM